jgi:hypothetical protein
MTKKDTEKSPAKAPQPISENNKKGGNKGSFINDNSPTRSNDTTTGSGGPRKK